MTDEGPPSVVIPVEEGYQRRTANSVPTLTAGSRRSSKSSKSILSNGGPAIYVSENTPLLNLKDNEEKSGVFGNSQDSSSGKRSKKLKRFYADQEDLLAKFEEDKDAIGLDLDTIKETDSGRLRKDRLLAQATFFVNVILLIMKVVVAYLTSSLSVISSVVDSAVDVTSGVVVWASTRAIEKHDPYAYPRGRSKLEPLAVIIVSVVMAVASLQIIIQAIEQLTGGNINPSVDIASLVMMGVVILTKLVLFIICYRQGTPSSRVLAVDHRNDLVSNIVATLCAFLAEKYYLPIDPIGAILVAIYIIITWCVTGAEQVPLLSGKTATSEYISRILRIVIDHDARINSIELLYVYHYGTKFLAEIHIVLDPEMPLRESHDLCDSLQVKLEHLPYIERAFVHCDYYADSKICKCGMKH